MDTEGLARETEIDICRFALRMLADEARAFQCDIPWSQAADWPAEVRAAAHRLSKNSIGPRRGENDGYRQTGAVSAMESDDWSAFVTFAPYAFEASVWSERSRELASLADEGASLVFRLTTDELAALVDFVGQERVIPVRQWNQVRRSKT